MTKRCSKCDRNLPLDSYRRKRSKKDGRQAACKDCKKKSDKEYLSRPEVKERRRKMYGKEYQKKYYKGYLKEYHKEYYKEYYANPEVKERRKEYLKEHHKEYYARPEVKERRKEYSARPEVKERKKEYYKEYYANNPEAKEKQREYIHNRNALKRSLPHDLTADEWQDTLDRFDGKCVYCGDEWEHQEHLWPLSKGGGYTRTNIVPACAPCNFSKNNKYPVDFITKDALYEILHTLGVH